MVGARGAQYLGAVKEHGLDVGGRATDGGYTAACSSDGNLAKQMMAGAGPIGTLVPPPLPAQPGKTGAEARVGGLAARQEGQQHEEEQAPLIGGEAVEGPKSASSTELGSDSCSSAGESDIDSDTDSETEPEGEQDPDARQRRSAVGGALTAESTILIFDWDDTLLPSTWIRDQGLRLDSECIPSDDQQAQLERVAQSVAKTMRIAERHGEVVLVTNAESGWIELSCRKFMPSLCPLLERVRTVSARSTYEHQGIASPFEWKYLAFEKEVNRFYENAPAGRRRNVISFGDSAHEREALIRVTQAMQNCCTKSLKFVERPEPEQLLKEHDLMSGCIRRVARHQGDLDLCVSCS